MEANSKTCSLRHARIMALRKNIPHHITHSQRIHQVVGNSLRTFQLESQELSENDPWTPYLASVAWAVRSTYHTVLNATAGQLVFG